MKVSKVLLNIMSVVCFLYGALYVFSLVFIPVGIYCFIAGRKFSYKAERLNDTMFMSNENFKYYVIFASIACFPLGLISIIPYVLIVGNKIKITETESLHIQKDEEESVVVSGVETEANDSKEEVAEEPKEVSAEQNSELTEEEKQEKFKKLQQFRDKGIITEEELELAKEQLFGKK